jgi:peptide/nickel transport system ATP-binding protein
MPEEKLLRIENLLLHFRTGKGIVQAVDGVDFTLDYNEAVVVIGESGCGKTSLAKAILRLLPRNIHTFSGKVVLTGSDVMRLSEEEFRRDIRWDRMAMVPQAAMNALNPVMRVGDQVSEPAIFHHGLNKAKALEQVQKMFQLVGVPADFINRYAFELSGGMRQRVALAMALVTSPDLIILDEPTSALDVLTQANIMNQLKRIKQDMGMSLPMTSPPPASWRIAWQ